MNRPALQQPTVAVLHPGQMGVAVAAQLRRTAVDVVWCPEGRSAATRTRAEQADLRPVGKLADLLAGSDVVVSICPPAAAEDLARTVAGHRYDGLYVDANAISPTKMDRIQQTLTGAGAHVIDGAIIGPPPRDMAAARLYLAGDQQTSTDFAALFTDTAVEPNVLKKTIGAASGLKMAYASYQKASRTLAAVAHALASDLDVTEQLLDEAHRNSGSPLADPGYLPSVAARAWRWAPEMHEVAETLRDADLPAEQAEAAAAALSRWNTAKDQRLSVAQVLQALHHPRG